MRTTATHKRKENRLIRRVMEDSDRTIFLSDTPTVPVWYFLTGNQMGVVYSDGRREILPLPVQQ